MSGEVYTEPFRPPEVLLRDVTYSYPADIWALGMSVLQMASGFYIDWTRDDSEIAHYLFTEFLSPPPSADEAGISTYDPRRYANRSDRPPRVMMELISASCLGPSRSGTDLLVSMLTVNPHRRPTALQALEHAFFFSSSEKSAAPTYSTRSHTASFQHLSIAGRFPDAGWRTSKASVVFDRDAPLVVKRLMGAGIMSLSAAYHSLELLLGADRYLELLVDHIVGEGAGGHEELELQTRSALFPACVLISNAIFDTETIHSRQVTPSSTTAPMVLFATHVIMTSTACSLLRSTLANYDIDAALLLALLPHAPMCHGLRSHEAGMALQSFTRSTSCTPASGLVFVGTALSFVTAEAFPHLFKKYLAMRNAGFANVCACVAGALAAWPRA